jgi:hypothetical protein
VALVRGQWRVLPPAGAQSSVADPYAGASFGALDDAFAPERDGSPLAAQYAAEVDAQLDE